MTLAQLSYEDLTQMNQAELNRVYEESEAGPIPDGEAKGTKLVFPESPAYESAKQQEEGGIIWEGKVFYCSNPEGPGRVKNNVNGQLMFEAEAYYGTSSLDGKECIILDYSKAPEFQSMRVMDEVRRVSENLYLGCMYRVEENGDTGEFLLNFILDFK